MSSTSHARPMAHRTRLATRALACALAASITLAPLRTIADDAEESKIAEARVLFTKGTQLARDAHWAEALSAFEQSAALRSHAVTTFNVAACLRATGRYALAREALERTFALDDAAGKTQLPETSREEARGYLGEIERVLARVTVTVDPADATLAIDGRPLKLRGGRERYVAGVQPPGPGERLPKGTIEVELDPGLHVFAVAKPGFAEQTATKSFATSAKETLALKLDAMPGTIRVTSSQPGAVVSLGDLDVGVAPVELSRPSGKYNVVVRKRGFSAFSADVNLKAGERVDVVAAMREEKPTIFERWWFWTGVAAVVGGTIAVTYYATRPEPSRPAPLTGGLGWSVDLR